MWMGYVFVGHKVRRGHAFHGHLGYRACDRVDGLRMTALLHILGRSLFMAVHFWAASLDRPCETASISVIDAVFWRMAFATRFVYSEHNLVGRVLSMDRTL